MLMIVVSIFGVFLVLYIIVFTGTDNVWASNAVNGLRNENVHTVGKQICEHDHYSKNVNSCNQEKWERLEFFFFWVHPKIIISKFMIESKIGIMVTFRVDITLTLP